MTTGSLLLGLHHLVRRRNHVVSHHLAHCGVSGSFFSPEPAPQPAEQDHPRPHQVVSLESFNFSFVTALWILEVSSLGWNSAFPVHPATPHLPH